MEERNEIQRPTILEVEDVKSEFIQVINKALVTRKLPFYMVDMILSGLVYEIKNNAKDELQTAKQQFEEQTKQQLAKQQMESEVRQ